MPYEDMQANALVFDDDLLRMECRASAVFLKALRGEAPGWQRHSTTKLWQGHEEALACYGMFMAQELHFRRLGGVEEGHIIRQLMPGAGDWLPEMPEWVGCLDIHVSHRSFLVAKNPNHYGPQFPAVKGEVSLRWPEW